MTEWTTTCTRIYMSNLFVDKHLWVLLYIKVTLHVQGFSSNGIRKEPKYLSILSSAVDGAIIPT